MTVSDLESAGETYRRDVSDISGDRCQMDLKIPHVFGDCMYKHHAF